MYFDKKGKINDIMDQLESEIVQEKDDIVLKSENKSDCVDQMGLRLKEIADDKVEADIFLNVIPETDLKKLQNKLKPQFEKAYVICFDFMSKFVIIVFFYVRFLNM